ncbi:hypothetical protein HPB50_004604 [Hyalomma asiaticum]|uniref:Uncharacterized protein n=1 Tax=Hyalomma asiaticum TaxID=266040 RepID=A0ACB7TH68_HYAAI|nr:hypothetical protein HPB50_004604 [Hyalomma asiaticum]
MSSPTARRFGLDRFPAWGISPSRLCGGLGVVGRDGPLLELLLPPGLVLLSPATLAMGVNAAVSRLQIDCLTATCRPGGFPPRRRLCPPFAERGTATVCPRLSPTVICVRTSVVALLATRLTPATSFVDS